MSVRTGAVVLILAVTACIVGLAGCCSLGLKSCSTTDELVLVGEKDLNNCNDTSSIPVTMRIYYLKQKDNFLKASFDQLWREPDQTLNSDIIGSKRSATVTPGGTVPVSLTRPAEATHIGIIADFCRDAGSWHKVIELENKGLRKTISLYQVRMSVLD